MMKNDENGQLSCGIYSSPAAARSPLQGWVGDRSIYIYVQSQAHDHLSTPEKLLLAPIFNGKTQAVFIIP